MNEKQVYIKVQADYGHVADFLRDLANRVETADFYYEVENFETNHGCVCFVEED